ncbi:alpha/beta hydrolase [Nocardia sp. SYP-A9097]|uniref:alpha/beta hydrolase n=1 Tax=Nocardia sp. SYP-A9097 TaxID=2663237 RepID=UPI00129AA94F|nr:alpha/beta hydrolase [Nocardia sp. SYP-A9097]MRH91778.1 alpha/beta hydrolase [Nocardia sp. SYP-A9097]
MKPAISKTFIGLESPGARRAGAGGHPCQGIYHVAEGTRPRVAMIAAHYQIDFSEHYLAEYMAARGIGFLGWNTRYRGYEWLFNLDQALVDIGVGVRWLREQGVEHVILLGNSGGGSLMAAYHSQAVEPCVRPARDMEPAPGIDDLVPGDGYVSLAAHLGRPDVLTAWMDPAVIDENDPTLTDPELDLFNPQHGPPFSPEFLERYRAAQVARNHRITVWAKVELERVTSRGYFDRHFTVARTWADPRMVDASLEPTERPPGMCYRGPTKATNYGDRGIGGEVTLRNWLNMWSLEESQCRAEPHLAKLTVPTLVMNPDGDEGVFPSDADRIFDAIPSTDKTRADLPGDHYFLRPEGARDAVADVIADWVAARFPVRDE